MTRQRRVLMAALLAVAWAAASGGALAGERGYYQWPDIHGETLVFASEGDLWRASVAGGEAVRLTRHEEVESHPAISPDGQWLAFSAHYDGAQEVYVMPLAGGAPRQLTFEGGGTAVRGWTPEGQVLFVSSNLPGTRPRVLRSVDIDSLAVETIPLDGANEASFVADGDTLFFTRFGLSLSLDNALFYRGGRMAQLWRYDLGGAAGLGVEAERLLADFGAPVRHPMAWEGRLYFLSDKEVADNIWSVDAAGRDLRRHTDFADWQLRNPRLSDGRIVYQRGADLFLYDIALGQERPIEITLLSDRDHHRRRWLEAPLAYLESARIAPEGDAAVLTVRGRAAIAFPGERRRIVLPVPAEARARQAVLGGDGLWVYLVQEEGEGAAIWRYPADGRGNGERFFDLPDAHVWGLKPSPDGRWLVYADTRGRLWALDLDAGQARVLDESETDSNFPFGDFAWSPDSRTLAYNGEDARGVSRVMLVDLETGRREVVTSGKYQAFAPAFSAAGDWLYFVSERSFDASPHSPWGDRNMGPDFDRRGRIYALQLDPAARFPFAADDEISLAQAVREDETADQEPAPSEIVFEGLAERIWSLPIEPGNYWNLSANEEQLYFQDWTGSMSLLKVIPLSAPLSNNEPEVEVFAEDIERYSLSSDGSTILFRQGDGKWAKLFLVPAEDYLPDDLDPYRVRVGDWHLGLSPHEEWRQMFDDAWRLHARFLFDSAMRGVDWPAMRAKYAPLIERIGHRAELDDVLKQMVAELGVLHSQVRGGELPRDPEGGLDSFLGAEFQPVPEGMEIAVIYRGDPDLLDRRGPLLKPGVALREGDILIAVDGRSLSGRRELTALLQHKAGQQVRLDLLRDGEALSVLVLPVDRWTNARLRYDHWVTRNRERVAVLGAGEIGYLHLRAMQGADMAGFARDFYEHYDKDALIIDVRGNRGGNIDSWIIATLLRRVWAYWDSPEPGRANTNMQQTFRGHLVVLVNEGTYSDGETFAAGIKALGLAPLIGTRTAGAGIWLNDWQKLVDRGQARISQFAQFGLDGRWLIEGLGIAPDIEVVNPPRQTFLGGDAQLDTAVLHLLERMAEDPIPELRGDPLPPLGTPGRDVSE